MPGRDVVVGAPAEAAPEANERASVGETPQMLAGDVPLAELARLKWLALRLGSGAGPLCRDSDAQVRAVEMMIRSGRILGLDVCRRITRSQRPLPWPGR